MSTFDSIRWRDEAIHHLFETIHEMKRDIAHLEALVMNAEMDRDAEIEERRLITEDRDRYYGFLRKHDISAHCGEKGTYMGLCSHSWE